MVVERYSNGSIMYGLINYGPQTMKSFMRVSAATISVSTYDKERLVLADIKISDKYRA